MEHSEVDCLDAETLAAYLDGLLTHEAVCRADRHIDSCRTCRGELSALAATHSFPTGSGGAFTVVGGAPIEGKLGRYEVLRELGRGSMGVVVRAWDPELARAVAVKILDPRLWHGPGSGDARDRLRREAQAMARLTHPNVVTVYDVVAQGDSLCIAMELVEGDTLRDRVRDPHRKLRATLAVCRLAGRGLAAAHAAKLIHRDFKPENVLCGSDGRVVVSDFGLARVDDERPALDAAASATVTTLAGTPAYMAPELFRGHAASIASDQFSFCVTTYEALYGERPFVGETLDDLREHIIAGVPRDAPATSRVPSWMRAALLRGLASDPARRFASMSELLAILEGEAPARRRRSLAIAGIAAAAVAVGALVVRAVPARQPSCEIDDSAIAWDRAAVESALRDRPERSTRITGALDAYARSWVATRRDACEATHVRGEQSERVLDARIACLDRGRRELLELTAQVTADPAVADRAVEAVYRLRDPASCASAAADTPIDAALRAELDRAAVLLSTGKTEPALAIATSIVSRVTEPAALAEALLLRGRGEVLLGKLDAAEASLAEALTAAERARADQLVAAIWVELVQTTGAQKHRFEAAQANVRAADAAFTRIEPGPVLRARYAFTVGTMLLAKGKLDDARTQLDRVLAITTAERPGDRGLAHGALCDVNRQQRRFDAARGHCRSAIELLGAAYGVDHPKLAPVYNIFGALELDDNKLEAARGHFAHAIEIFERNNLTGERALALALSNTAVSWMRGGDVERARPLYERAAEIFAKHHPDHPQRTLPLQGLASIALELDDHRTAIRFYEEALAVIETVYGKDNDQRTVVLYNLALAYQRLHELDKAIELTDEAIAQSQHPGRESWPMVAHALDLQASITEEDRKDDARSIELRQRALAALDKTDKPTTRAWIESKLGDTLRRTGKPALAVPPLEHAVAYYDRDRSDPYAAGAARWWLARALWDTGKQARAIDLAKAARAELAAAKLGLNLAGIRAELDRWLRARGVDPDKL